MKTVTIFTGSDIGFQKLISGFDNVSEIRDLINVINVQRHEISGAEKTDITPAIFEYLYIGTDDYYALSEWANNSFLAILKDPRINVVNLFLCNPPRKIRNDIEKCHGDILSYESTKYLEISDDIIRDMNIQCKQHIRGQNDAIDEILISIYSQTYSRRPIVVLLNGNSGIGKTETAKIMCNCVGGELTRIQLSMYQNAEAYNYVFGGEHGKNTLTRDLIRRENNLIHIDELDKVNPALYNAFYQMFDEGIYKDQQYQVDVADCIFLCTSNFRDALEAKRIFGDPLYSRFDSIIEFKSLSIDDRIKITEETFSNIINKLPNQADKTKLNESNTLKVFSDLIMRGSYSNIRILKKDIQRYANKVLVEAKQLLNIP